MRLPSKAPYFGNSSLPPGSPSFLVPRSTHGFPGMFEVAEMLYCYYGLNHLEDSVVPVTLERTNSIRLEFPEVFHRETLQETKRDRTSETSESGYRVFFSGNCSMVNLLVLSVRQRQFFFLGSPVLLALLYIGQPP